MEWEIVNYEEDRSEYLGQKKKKQQFSPTPFLAFWKTRYLQNT